MLRFTILSLAIISSSCSSQFEEIKSSFEHKVSPDKQALVYQNNHQNGAKDYSSSLTVWFKKSGQEGGAGIFDIRSNELQQIAFNWQNDSSISITIPANSQIIRKETQVYFLGRTNSIHYSYESEKEFIETDGYSLIIHRLDSFETEKVKKENEDNFYTAVDDLMWFTNMLLEKLDSQEIPIFYTEFDHFEVITKQGKFPISDTTTDSYYTFYEVTEDSVIKRELFDLMEKHEIE